MAESARQLTERFLIALEARRMSDARACWGDTVHLIAVGGRQYSDLDQFVAGSAKRYRRVGKHRLKWDTWPTERGHRILSRGTLFGELLDGSPFDDVRYVDLFDVVGGVIVRQEIWNDFDAVDSI